MTKDYTFSDIGSAMCGYMSFDSPNASASRWCGYAENILSMTFETNNGFPNESGPYSSNEQKANSELMGNWLATLFSTYSALTQN